MNKKELKEILKEDKIIYFGKKNIKNIIKYILRDKYMRIGKYIILSRKCGYYQLNIKNPLNKILFLYYTYRKNRLGEKLNIELQVKTFGRRLKIYHGNVIINGHAEIGDDCEFHGSNCLGNKGSRYNLNISPIIGNNVVFGVGSNAIGNVHIGDNTIISANTLVNKSFSEGNCMIAGIPAKKIKDL